MNNKKLTWLLLLAGFIVMPMDYVSAKVLGQFTAQQACEAYVSKKKQTNPDNTTLTIGQSYSFLETNKAKSPDWLRIDMPQASPSLRWVSIACGEMALASQAVVEESPSTPVCRTAGLADSYKLAVSWQPAFCESFRRKPECRIDDVRAYQASHFTLHGLWPNKNSCGINYNYCGDQKSRAKKRNFCEHKTLSLDEKLRDRLEFVMPSAAAGTCLQRHEWYKHGTCQDHWDVNQYFAFSIELTQQFNHPELAMFMKKNIGKTVKESVFYTQVDKVFGDDAHKRLRLGCDKQGRLVDVYINLPKNINTNASLGELVQQAQPDFGSTCKGRFKVDAIGY